MIAGDFQVESLQIKGKKVFEMMKSMFKITVEEKDVHAINQKMIVSVTAKDEQIGLKCILS